MNELAQRLAALRDDMVPHWGDARSERAYAELGRLQRGRRTRSFAAGTCGSVLALCGVAYLLLRLGSSNDLTSLQARDVRTGPALGSSEADPSRSSVAISAEGDRLLPGSRLRLADGSQVEVMSADGEVFVQGNQPDQIELRLAAGNAHFDVVPNTQRRFSVTAGSVEVVAVGTAFDVERAQDRVRVVVTDGQVRVHSVAGVASLQAGESRWFEQGEEPSPTSGDDSVRGAVSVPLVKARLAQASRIGLRKDSHRLAWRSLSRSGDYERAYQLLAQGAAMEDDAETLMDAGDAARLSNHPEAAVRYLRKVLRKHRKSAATPLAAFTLGRVLLERLGRPAEAAAAFATARRLAPQASLAQDALAREVEAWSKAGRAEKAHRRARRFVKLYPVSRRLRGVQLYGGLLAP